MFIALTILIIITALFLIFIVLIQNSKDGGLNPSFSNSNQLMGVRKTTDFVEKATWFLAGTMVVLSICTTFVLPTAGEKSIAEEITPSHPAIPNLPQTETQTAPQPEAATPVQETPAQ